MTVLCDIYNVAHIPALIILWVAKQSTSNPYVHLLFAICSVVRSIRTIAHAHMVQDDNVKQCKVSKALHLEARGYAQRVWPHSQQGSYSRA